MIDWHAIRESASRGPLLGLVGSFALLAPALFASDEENLVPNGTFDHEEGGLVGWNTDYEWTGNSHYVANKERVEAVEAEGGKTEVIKITPATDAGAKMESIPIVFEPGYRYTCSLDVKGGGYRIYFAGYKWQPGIAPHEEPTLGELRLIYKSRATSGQSADWENVELSLPGVELSAQAKAHLQHVRFVTVYIWFVKPGFVDNVVVTRTPDESVDF